MNPEFSKAMRASIVGRARFIEDLVEAKAKEGATQYIILALLRYESSFSAPNFFKVKIFVIY